ncbi:class I SAM-dependent methyltransferase [Shewanella waksmanii]|uniref:class I SAM-dependent methyltransferase n=1 Tax=Shewanella waksmanii TaxID=213783 RepID=UPI0037357767
MKYCPLCDSQQLDDFHQDKFRQYVRCQQCDLISVADKYLLTSEQEKAIYDQHQNDANDSGYRRFLGRAWQPLQRYIDSSMRGLDFGCGPGPTISVMAKEQGMSMSDYDLYYFNDPQLLQQRYDFITMTEVIEHVADAKQLVAQLDSLMADSSVLVVMTKRAQHEAAFAKWHYKNDLTHIRFYSDKTFIWLANHLGWRLEFADKDVVLLFKST